MNRFAALLFAVLLPSASFAQGAAKLAGRYQMEMDASQVLELRANGTGSLDGEEMKWSAAGNKLTIKDSEGSETMTYSLQGDRLVLVSEGIELGFKRVGAGGAGGSSLLAKAQAKAQANQGANAGPAQPQPNSNAQGWGQQGARPGVQPGAQGPQGGGNPQDAQLKQLLLSSAWCSFSYKGSYVGGHHDRSSSGKAVFQADGTGALLSQGETYSAGWGGTYAGGQQGGQQFRWAVQNLRLYIDLGQGMQDVNLEVNRNSNGYPILKADGVEYMMCN